MAESGDLMKHRTEHGAIVSFHLDHIQQGQPHNYYCQVCTVERVGRQIDRMGPARSTGGRITESPSDATRTSGLPHLHAYDLPPIESHTEWGQPCAATKEQYEAAMARRA